jgi:predicted dehydrogenase
MTKRIPRRRFLQGSAALASASFFVNPSEAGQPGGQPPRQRVRVAVIGVAGQGTYNLNETFNTKLADIVALCDVDADRAAPLRQRFPKARFADDYRRLLDNPRDLDAVVIATPDHHHAIPAVMAMRAGKHVYCEKPLAHSVHEVRAMMEAARQNKVITQMGTQIHAGENYRRVVEMVQSGMIGTVRRVHVWCSRRPDPGFRVKEPTPPPRNLNYDLWLGPAPERPYPPFRTGSRATVHFDWRWWWDYGGGVLADMACHFMDLPHWALGLRQPTSVAATGQITYKGDNDMPDLLQVEYEYPARGAQPPVHLTWYSGVAGPDITGKVRHQGFDSGVLFVGERGSLVADYGNYRLLPEDRFRNAERPKPSIPRSVGHHREWLQAILNGGGATTCNFDYSGALAETVLLGNVAYKAGGKLQYDAKTGRATGPAGVDGHLRREYRRGWTL